MSQFIIFGSPRSRTAWLSRFLSYGEWFCSHDEIRHLRSMEDVASWFTQPTTGTVETAASPWWRTVLRVAPDARVVVLRRPVNEVVDSFMRLNLGFDRDGLTKVLTKVDHKLQQIARRVPGALYIEYSELTEEATCARIFEHCLQYKHDHQWWEFLSQQNIQINMAAMCRYFAAYNAQVQKLAAQAKCYALAEMHRKPVREPEELVFREETLEAVWNDAKGIMEQHCADVGDHPQEFRKKNWDLMNELQRVDAYQIMTARSNGRMFGYLLTTLGPSLESPDRRVACHTFFYASGEFKGLGRQLLRASQDALREKGVDELYLRAGIRGDGPRLGAVYKRMGAEDYGKLYKINLKE